jgi:hypothetical protein
MAAEWTDRDRIAGNLATFSRLAAVIDLDSQDPEYLRAMAFWLERWAEGSAKDLWKLADALNGQ